MTYMHSLLTGTWKVAVPLLLCSVAFANVIAPGSAGLPDGFTVGGTGLVLLASHTLTLTAPGYSGVLDVAVYSDPANPFCAGCLDFFYQARVDTGLDAIIRLTASDFAGLQTDLGDVVDGVNLPGGLFVNGFEPATTVDRNAGGDTVGFSFAAPILPGTTGQAVGVKTDATSFGSGQVDVFDGIDLPNATIGPAVPEPGSFALVTVGSLIVLFLARLRQVAKPV
jgi:hypothetical protein